MVLYGITLVPLAEELKAAGLRLLSPLYADDVTFYGSALQSAQILKLSMDRGPDQGYFPEPANYLFIFDLLRQEEVTRREFVAEGLLLNFVSGSRYIWAYLGPQEELKTWVKPQVEALSHGVRLLDKIALRHPQSNYAANE